mmetsp:Transcript_3058/g.3922  ORF Transcript_3058/g.3922 Transcript_3058/m.3922 type:complete len:93 (-) Transcript_3058:958-1236(-)
MELPALVCQLISPGFHEIHLKVIPVIQYTGQHSGDMCAQRPVHSSTLDAQEDPQIRGGPTGLIARAVRTNLITLPCEKNLKTISGLQFHTLW